MKFLYGVVAARPTEGAVFEAKELRLSVNRYGRGIDVAEAVAFFTNPSSGYITGSSLCVDGGWAA